MYKKSEITADYKRLKNRDRKSERAVERYIDERET
jgi:hypothetical protein